MSPSASDRGWYLRQWREFRGLSQEGLAELYGCYKADVSKWERSGLPNGRRWNSDVLARMAGLLDVESWWLVHVDPFDPDNDLDLLQALRRLPKSKRHDAMRIINALAEPSNENDTAPAEPAAPPKRRARANRD